MGGTRPDINKIPPTREPARTFVLHSFAPGAHTFSPIRRPLGLIMAWICPEGARKPPSSRRRPSAGPTRTRTPSSSLLRALGTRLIFLTSQQRTIRPAEAATAAPCTTATPAPSPITHRNSNTYSIAARTVVCYTFPYGGDLFFK